MKLPRFLKRPVVGPYRPLRRPTFAASWPLEIRRDYERTRLAAESRALDQLGHYPQREAAP